MQHLQKTRKQKILSERFFEKVALIPFHTCWEWIGAVASNGYGVINQGRRTTGIMRAHRVSWEIHFGPVPDKLWVLHKCDNRTCVNPAHLFLGTRQDNVDDMVNKKRNVPRKMVTMCPRGHTKSPRKNGNGFVCYACMRTWRKRRG